MDANPDSPPELPFEPSTVRRVEVSSVCLNAKSPQLPAPGSPRPRASCVVASCRGGCRISLLQRAELLVAGRALREMVVGRIVDWQFAPGETLQQLGRRAALTGRIRVRAPEQQSIRFQFGNPKGQGADRRSSSAISVSVLVAGGEKMVNAGNDL